MCGILVHLNGRRGDNSRIRLRGQDGTHMLRMGDYTFVHNLLWVTGERTPQPFVEGDVVCVYNGEIYNHPYTRSDGEVLIPLYREYGVEFPRQLDGEFAIALYDLGRGRVVFATDPFGTKPLYVKGTECASYRSGVGGQRLPANTIQVVEANSQYTLPVHTWEFDYQHKDIYDDWISAFEAAIRKRAKPGCFLGLSAGYDSGGIACELLRQGVAFKAYIYPGQEDQAILEQRAKLVPEAFWFQPNPLLREDLAALYGPQDNEKYSIRYDGVETSMRLLDDGGLYGSATIAQLAHLEGRKVALSGQGGDEILSDYAPWHRQSELRGVFTDPLVKWWNFNRGCQESYLLKEEYATGAFSVETRYPYLDRALVQEFLWLTVDAKNRHYKAPLREYLLRHGFPLKEDQKTGFSVYL